MNRREIRVSCIYQEEGARMEDLIMESFRLFLKRILLLKQGGREGRE